MDAIFLTSIRHCLGQGIKFLSPSTKSRDKEKSFYFHFIHPLSIPNVSNWQFQIFCIIHNFSLFKLKYFGLDIIIWLLLNFEWSLDDSLSVTWTRILAIADRYYIELFTSWLKEYILQKGAYTFIPVREVKGSWENLENHLSSMTALQEIGITRET